MAAGIQSSDAALVDHNRLLKTDEKTAKPYSPSCARTFNDPVNDVSRGLFWRSDARFVDSLKAGRGDRKALLGDLDPPVYDRVGRMRLDGVHQAG